MGIPIEDEPKIRPVLHNIISKEKVFTMKNSSDPKNQKELAESYGISQQTMNNYMRMANMIPELEELVDTGIVTPTTAHAIIYSINPSINH